MNARGSVSVIALAGVLVLCLTALAAADLGAMVIARARAAAAADAAALAAAVRQAPVLDQAGAPADAAREQAERNGARLVACVCDAGQPDASVIVEIEPRLTMLRGWFDRRVRASAHAALDPDVFSYRDD